jgi:carbon-monoxide dehydrogenase large subunit
MAHGFGIGQPVLRKEDLRLLTGTGKFTDDFSLPGQTFGYLLRSSHAHARIRSIDVSAAAARPGVRAVLTARDYLDDGAGPILHVANPPDINDPKTPAFRNRDETPVFIAPHYPMADDKVRHVGEGVCFLVADTLELAKDAAEHVVIDYEVLAAVTESGAAIADGAPLVWEDARNNIASIRCLAMRPPSMPHSPRQPTSFP